MGDERPSSSSPKAMQSCEWQCGLVLCIIFSPPFNRPKFMELPRITEDPGAAEWGIWGGRGDGGRRVLPRVKEAMWLASLGGRLL